MVKKVLFKTRIAMIFIILMLVEILLSSGFAMNRGIALTKEILGNQAYEAAYTVSQLIDGDKLEEVIISQDSSHPYYSALQERLSESRRTLGLKYLYTMTKDNDGKYIYIVDGLDKDSDNFSKLGATEDFEEYFENFELALNGEIVKDDFAFNSEWGNLVSAYIPIKNSGGEIIAFLGADLEASTILAIMNKSSILMVIVTIFITLLGVIGALAMARRIASPITKLRDYSREAEGGSFAGFISSNHQDEVGEIAAIIESRMEAVKTILDNTGQGFLTFGEDMLVNPEYSAECSNIFGGNIEGKDFLGLIHPEDLEKRKFIGAVLVRLLKEKNPDRRSIYFPLLSEELSLNGRSISVDYRIISNKSGEDQRFMVILTDVTEKRALESKIEKERDIFRMVVKVAVNCDDFMMCTRDYNSFFTEILTEIIQCDKTTEEKLNEIFRQVHTLKGCFSQLGMDGTASGLHSLESKLSELTGGELRPDLDALRRILTGFDHISVMEGDINLLKEILGEDFLNRFAGLEKGLVIDRAKLLDIEKKMLSLLSPMECKLLLPDIQKLRYRPMRELLRSYPDYVAGLSDRLGKQVHELEISGGEYQVDIERYSSFTKSLTHVFRNALDHGIETLEERLEAGKDEMGSICCTVFEEEDSLHIEISDDGYGMDAGIIKKKAVEKGMYTKEQIDQLSEKEILDIVFREGFSTKEQVSETSGRGMGLPAVLAEVEKLQGKISISTKAGQGTKFSIVLPVHKPAALKKLTIYDIISPLLDKVVVLIESQLGEKSSLCMNLERMNRVVLKKYTAFTDINGILSGRLALSFDEGLARRFAAGFSIDSIPSEDEADYIEDSISECLNIILGNSIKMFQGLEELVLYSSPVTISSEGTIIKYPESDVWTCSIEFESGQMSLDFAVPKGTLL